MYPRRVVILIKRMTRLTVPPESAGARLDIFLTQQLGISRAAVQKLIHAGAVSIVNGPAELSVHHFLTADDVVVITANERTAPLEEIMKPTKPLPVFPLVVVAETEEYIVVNKPAGIPVHPDSVHPTGTLIQQVVAAYPDIALAGGDTDRPGVVHRLDKDVSGLLVIARTQAMFKSLKEQFAGRAVEKEYLALVYGQLTPIEGSITFPLARGKKGRIAARPSNQTGREALTEYSVLEYFANHSLLSLTLHTGRTHQLRAHCLALGHPMVGDTLYHTRKQKTDRRPLARVFLHAIRLGFFGSAGQAVEYKSELPTELETYLASLPQRKVLS